MLQKTQQIIQKEKIEITTDKAEDLADETKNCCFRYCGIRKRKAGSFADDANEEVKKIAEETINKPEKRR